ncbi:unnamed protein product [Paramecium pentaurelia]|uniref:Protein kinase domain-containing protein n=1 Tax=Paramecium pentaurelia TaxID=43138 RepID=A0A8S1XY98_9CILI|nr:unnamed protein product [Paramecium pentaurelia]
MFCCKIKNTIQSTTRNYELLDEIGMGSYGKVKLAKDVKSKKKYAIKLIEKQKMEEFHAENNILTEIRIQSKLHHPHIVELVEYFEDEKFIYLVQEYCSKGTLRQQICKRRLQENEIYNYIYQLNEALIYLHRQRIVHRDLKLDNILLDDNDTIKLTDFNWATKLNSYAAEPTNCGTTHYMPPEIVLLQPHTEKVDSWSLGIIIFELVFQHRPFEGLTQEELQKQIIYHNPLTDCKSIPTDLIMLLNCLLTKNPIYRLNCEQVKVSQWFQRQHHNSFLQADESVNLTNITYNKNDNI